MYQCFNSCVWASKTPEEFENEWSSTIAEFGLELNEWFATRYQIRVSWVPDYFKDVFLAGIFLITSRSKNANSFSNCFIGLKNVLVQFWIRFVNAIEEQCHNELEADNATLHTMPVLRLPWE